MILTGCCASVPVVLEPDCAPTEEITADPGTPEFVDQIHDQIVILDECIKQWEEAFKSR